MRVGKRWLSFPNPSPVLCNVTMMEICPHRIQQVPQTRADGSVPTWLVCLTDLASRAQLLATFLTYVACHKDSLWTLPVHPLVPTTALGIWQYFSKYFWTGYKPDIHTVEAKDRERVTFD